MSDDFQTGICGGNWWNVARSGGYDGPTMSAATASGSCSATIGNGGGAFSWTAVETAEGKARSCDEPTGSASGSSITFQDSHKAQPSDHVVGGPLMDSSTLQFPGFGLSPSAMDWTQALLRSSGRAETSFHAMLQDDLSSKPFFHQDPSIDSDQVHTGSDMNQSMLLDQHHLSSGNEPGDCGINNLFEPNTNPHQSIYDNRSMNYQSPMMGYRGSPSDLSQPSWPKFSQFMIKASPPKQQSTNQLHFLNNTPFWNASAAAASQVRLGYYPQTTPTQFTTQNFDQKPNCSKANSGGARDSSSSSSMTKKGSSSSEPTSKKPRIETPSPLPTFKVRKEKLGDRITALQQLVSPFGKTDTASVLHEAIEYIKFLHDQVGVLSSPYLKNGHPMQHQQQNPDKPKDGEGPEQDLRSRGLCLVPISSTYPMASETPMEFWNPTFGGSYR